MKEVLRMVVKGRVQGVGFRFYTEDVAHRYKVDGWVRNMPGGDVEILARLPVDLKDRFLAAIREGPPLSRVESVSVRKEDPEEWAISGFHIRH